MLSHGPKIVTDGLVLALDAADNNSYPGSGITWTDLSGNGNTGTLTNGPTYSSSNGGSIVFDGVNDYVKCNNSSVADNLTNMSVSGWVYANWTSLGSLNMSPIITKISDAGSGTGWEFGTSVIVGATRPNIYFYTQSSGGASYKTSTCSISPGSYWMNVTSTYSGGPNNNALLYINGIQQTLVYYNVGTVASISTSSAVTLSSRDGTNSYGAKYSNINIAQVSIYNRALTASEIQQNFNVLRGRFGI